MFYRAFDTMSEHPAFWVARLLWNVPTSMEHKGEKKHIFKHLQVHLFLPSELGGISYPPCHCMVKPPHAPFLRESGAKFGCC